MEKTILCVIINNVSDISCKWSSCLPDTHVDCYQNLIVIISHFIISDEDAIFFPFLEQWKGKRPSTFWFGILLIWKRTMKIQTWPWMRFHSLYLLVDRIESSKLGFCNWRIWLIQTKRKKNSCDRSNAHST